MNLRQHAWRLAVSLSGVGLITFLAYAVVRVNATTVGFAYLLLVLVVAAGWGFLESLVCAIVATLGFNFYFLPPVGTLTIADPQNWAALFSFLTTAIIASRLSARIRQRALEAIEHRQEVERLYTFSRAILLIGEGEPFPKQLALKLAEIFELTAVVLYDRRTGEFYRAGPADFKDLDNRLRDAALQGISFSGTDGGRAITAVRLGSEPIASLALQGSRVPDAVLQGIANLIAIGLERARAQNLAHQVEAARESEQLRTTLIDAMAHEFKTPLTSIKAATTSLRSNPEQPAAARNELIEIADEETEHLQKLIEDAVEMARLDAAHIEIQPALADLFEIIREAIASLRAQANGRSIDIAADSSLPLIAFDRRLVKLAIRQLLDNALKYSPPETSISVATGREDRSAFVEIANAGPGIPIAEQSRVFQRFYRSPSVQHQAPGTGLGLSIAYSIAQAHGGNLTLSSHPGKTIVRLTLPELKEEK